MFTLVVGGAASGKSEYAEQLILRAGALPRYYVATMEPFGAEARARIARHRVLRAQKRFETIECPVGLSRVLLPARGAALLECLSNLAANELYSPAGAGGEQAALAAVVDGVESLRRQCEALVVVTGEVFSGGSAYAGAVAAMPLLDMARAVYMDCYTFEEGGIEAYTPQGGEG